MRISAFSRLNGLVVATLVGAAFPACEKTPVETTPDPQLTLSADSVVLDLYGTSPLSAAVVNTTGSVQYVSRDPGVAGVTASGAVSGVAPGSTYVVATLLDRPDVRDSARVRVFADSCSGARPDFGGVATDPDRDLFSYDIDAPLNLQKTLQSTEKGVEVSNISFTSPDGGTVSGMMWDPATRPGLRPAIVLMHGLPGNETSLTSLAEHYASYGAVVITIGAPWNRRAGSELTLTPQDSAEQVQVIKDLQRAVDVLRTRPNVDDDRIAFIGFSWGGATGALFVGIERRLKAAALVVGHGGQVSHLTGPVGHKHISAKPCNVRVAWVRAMTPIEPLRFVGHANVPLLLQNGKFDDLVPVYEAEELHRAAPPWNDARWYEAGHNLSATTALIDRLKWLQANIGLEATPGG